MNTNVTKDNATATIIVEGFLNANTATDLEEQVEQAMSDCASAVFDFSSLEYISSAGLRVLMVAYKKATAAGGTVRVEGACDEVREVFEITGFSDLFEIS